MQNLTPVGLSQDGRRLLLVSPSGEEFAVPVDTRLRAALRGENARLGQLEMKMESALRPRDIQARIRAGESAEDVAAAAQTTVDAIMGFAMPVLAERAHVAQTALKASVRRRSGESSSGGRPLGEAAALFFSDHGLHDEDVEWDAWRRPDGRWALVATYAVGGRPRTAEFTHDLPGRYVVALNEEALILTGEVREPEARQATGPRTGTARLLSSVPSQDELPLGDDAIELVRDRQPDPHQLEGEPAAEEPSGQAAVADPTMDPAAAADADWISQAAPDAPSEHQQDAGPGGQPDTRPDTGPATAPITSPDPDPDLGPDTEPIPEVDASLTAGRPSTAPEAEQPVADAPPPPPKKKSRSSVPSWDEIMFGGGKND